MCPDENGNPLVSDGDAFCHDAQAGDLEQVKRWVEQGIDVNV